MSYPASPPPVERMSLTSNESLNEKTTPYIGMAVRSGSRPKRSSSSAARSSASGSRRNTSQTGGASGGSGPSDGCRSKSPRHVTDRSPRMFSVASAFSCPAFAMPAIMPNCCCTVGSDAVASMRPYSSGGPRYSSTSGSTVDALIVSRGKRSAAPARTAPAAAATGAPSSVTSTLATPL